VIVETPDGKREFPDDMSKDEIRDVLRKKYGFKSDTDVTGGAYTYDKSDGWAASLHNLAVKMNNITRTGADAYTYGGLDALQGLAPGSPSAADLRAQTEASRKDLGTATAAVVDAVARTANPLSRVGGTSIPGMAASSAAQQAASAALHGADPQTIGTEAAKGGALAGALGVAGKYVSPSLLINAARRELPAWTAGGIGYLGGGPLTGWLAQSAVRNSLPAARPYVPNATPWLGTYFNPGAQGALSGYDSRK
jgi:hypothetical protein